MNKQNATGQSVGESSAGELSVGESKAGAQSTLELQAEVRHRERQIAAIRHLSDALFSQLGTDELMRETLRVALDVLAADAGSLQMHDAETDTLIFRYVASPAHASLIGHRTPISQGISGRVFRTGVAELAADVTQVADFNPAVDALTGYQTHSMLAVPIKRPSGASIGVLQALNLRRSFDQGDLEVLEVLGAQAATAIENARLAELERRAEIVNVLGNVAHDLYNMLTPLQVGLQTLKPILDNLFLNLEVLQTRYRETPCGQELTAAAAEAGAEYGWILEQTLDSNARVQARAHWIAGAVKGKLPEPLLEAGDLNETVRQVSTSLGEVARQRSIRLILDLEDALPPALFDSEHIYNALYNLTNNAIPATPPGGSITLRTRAPAAGNRMLLVEVEDTGRGMTSEVREKLFTDAAISTTPGGTGLGTRIVKHVVDQHKGSISVQSEPGRGSTFSIRLPLSPQ